MMQDQTKNSAEELKRNKLTLLSTYYVISTMLGALHPFFFLLKYIWFTVLFKFQVYNIVIHNF